MDIQSYLIATTSPELRSRWHNEEDVVTVAILPADIHPTKALLAEELKKTLPHTLHECDHDLIPTLAKADSITWFGIDEDCPPGCSSIHVACYPEYRSEFDLIAPDNSESWCSHTDVAFYPFGY